MTLEPGEFVVRASVARRFKDLLEQLNLEEQGPYLPEINETFGGKESPGGLPGSMSPLNKLSHNLSPSQQGLGKIRKMSISLNL